MIEMNGVDGNYSAFAKARQRADHHVTAGSEGDGAIQLDGKLIIFASDPGRAQRGGQLAMKNSSRRNIHFAFPCLQNCDGEAGGGSEPEKAYSFARLDARDAQAAEPDDASAQ